MVLLAAGAFGLTSYIVRLRTQEFGIRLTLGARPGQIAGAVIWRVARITIAGCALGLTASLTINLTLAQLLFDISPADPSSLALTAVVLVGVAVAGAVLPALQTTRLDPATTVRAE